MTESTTAFPIEFTQEKLLESLHNLHESSRLAKEIETEEKKLTTLTNIRNNFRNDAQPPPGTMKTLFDNIAELEAKIKKLQSEMDKSEEKVVQGFQDILMRLAEITEGKAEGFKSKVKKELQDYILDNTNQIDARIRSIETSVTQLENTKLDAAAEARLNEAITAGKEHVKAVQRESMENMILAKDQGFQQLQKRVDAQLEQFKPEKITDEIIQSTLSSMEPHLKSFIADTKSQNQKLLEDYQTAQTDKLKDYVKQAVLEHVDANNLQKIITTLPEFQNLQQLANEISNKPADDIRNLPEIAALKQSMTALAFEMAQLKQVTDSTRALVATLKEHGVPSPSQVAQFDLAASVKHMEDIEKDMKVMYNSVKMMEAMMSVNGMQGTRKRRRDESQEGDQDEEIMARLAKIEERQDMLQDFIFQYERTILHENYPLRVNQSMQKIQTVLLNHERFIAFLVAPFAQSTREVTLPHQTTEPSEAMVEAIQTLVRKTAEEMALPLQNQIKLLEDKLNMH